MKSIRLYLKPNEKLYLNGAVIRVDRKVAIELLNDANFLLANHVLQAENADTPLRQLYFVVQMMLMDPMSVERPLELFHEMASDLRGAIKEQAILDGIAAVEAAVAEGDYFNALKILRQTQPAEAELLGRRETSTASGGETLFPPRAATATGTF
jgi:flagellar biosynthesis repressor protein FlbT